MTMKKHPSPPIKIISLWPLLLPLLLFLPGLSGFPFPGAAAQFSDMVISHYPNAVYLKQAILDFGTIPLWSPTILSGYPFLAEPIAGLWYPLGWPALLFPLPLGFNIMVLLHILWGGIGMYCLLRAENLSHRASLVGALAFEFLPKIFAHFGAGHLTLVYAVFWTPWLLLSSIRLNWGFQILGCRFRFGLVSGLILGLIFLADPRWAAFAGLLWMVYWFTYSCERREKLQGGNTISSRLREILVKFRVLPLVVQIVISVLVAFPLLIPLLEYTRLSTRAHLTPADLFVFSLPLERLLGLIYPDWGGNHELVLYPGGVIFVFGLVALLERSTHPKKRFWFWAALISLLYALGSSIPLLSYIALLPGISLLRVPSRALFVTGIALSALAAYGTEILMHVSGIRNRRRINLVLTALTTFVLILTAGFIFLTSELLVNFIWGTAMIVLAVIGVAIILGGRVPAKIWFVALLGLALLDLLVMDSSVLNFRPQEAILSEQQEMAQYLVDQEGIFRVYSPSYSLPQQTAVTYGLELADGVDPLQLAAYAEFMDAATGVPRPSYGVTLPPFANGDPSRDNAAYLPDPFLLGLINVRFVAAEYDLVVDGLELRKQFGQTRLYENLLARPRVWVQIAGADTREYRDVTSIERRPNQISLRAEGPGLLVLSEISYPGWQVTIDDTLTPLQETVGLLRAVPLEAGEHEVRFIYRPKSLYLGFLGLVGGVTLWFGFEFRQRKQTHHD